RRDIVQWPQDKFPLGKARMRNDQFGAVNDLIAVENDVDIDRARPVMESRLATEVVFEVFDRPEQCERFQSRFTDQSRVQEGWLVGYIGRSSLINGRNGLDLEIWTQIRYCSPQSGQSVPNIGAQGHCNPGFR